MKKYLFFIFGIVLIAAISAGWIFRDRSARETVVIDRRMYPVGGIDVSAHNGEIDFEQVALDSVDFVYVKCTEGSDFLDRRYKDNIFSARRAGLKTGPYHFFRFNVSGSAQAMHMLTALDGVPTDLPWAIDVESWGNDDRYDRSDVIRQLRGMVAVLRDAGREVVIYTNKNGFGHFIDGIFADVPLWICSKQQERPQQDWIFWQYSHTGKVRGVGGDVDLNVFNGDSALWNKKLEEWSNKRPVFPLNKR